MLFQDFKELLNLALFDQLHELRELPHKILIHRHKLPRTLQAMLDHHGVFEDLNVMGKGGLGQSVIESTARLFFFFQKLLHGIHPHGITECLHNLI